MNKIKTIIFDIRIYSNLFLHKILTIWLHNVNCKIEALKDYMDLD